MFVFEILKSLNTVTNDTLKYVYIKCLHVYFFSSFE